MEDSIGKIYKLECLNTGKVYIGSTTCKYLSQRLSSHVNCYKRWVRGQRSFITSFQIIEGGNYEISLIENCSSREELAKRERFYIDSMTCVNKNLPRGANESVDYKCNSSEYTRAYYVKNKQRFAEYYKQNRERILTQQKQYKTLKNHPDRPTTLSSDQ